MCGIVGYVGEKQAAPILLDGLSKLEYRGYDSAGIAVYDGQEIEMKKSKGRLKVLNELTHDGATLPGTVGIGHTRWATHGEPSDVNAVSYTHLDVYKRQVKLSAKGDGTSMEVSYSMEFTALKEGTATLEVKEYTAYLANDEALNLTLGTSQVTICLLYTSCTHQGVFKAEDWKHGTLPRQM